VRIRRTGESFEEAAEALVEKLTEHDVDTLLAELQASGSVGVAATPAPDEELGCAD